MGLLCVAGRCCKGVARGCMDCASQAAGGHGVRENDGRQALRVNGGERVEVGTGIVTNYTVVKLPPFRGNKGCTSPSGCSPSKKGSSSLNMCKLEIIDALSVSYPPTLSCCELRLYLRRPLREKILMPRHPTRRVSERGDGRLLPYVSRTRADTRRPLNIVACHTCHQGLLLRSVCVGPWHLQPYQRVAKCVGTTTYIQLLCNKTDATLLSWACSHGSIPALRSPLSTSLSPRNMARASSSVAVESVVTSSTARLLDATAAKAINT